MMDKTLHVLGLSGGKDSAALAMYMKDHYPELDIKYYFTDTGKELPEVNEFVDLLAGYVDTIVDPYEEVFTSNREKKDFDYHLRQHKSYLPSPQARWCTIQMKLVPFEKWIQMKMEKEGYTKVISYVGIRADEPAREGFLTNAVTSEYLTIKMPFREDGLGREDIFNILRKADLLHDDPEVSGYRELFLDQETREPIEPSEEDKITLTGELLKIRQDIKLHLSNSINSLEVLHIKSKLIDKCLKIVNLEGAHSSIDKNKPLDSINFDFLKSDWMSLVSQLSTYRSKSFHNFEDIGFLIESILNSNNDKDKVLLPKLNTLNSFNKLEQYLSILKSLKGFNDVEAFLAAESIMSVSLIDNLESDLSKAVEMSSAAINMLGSYNNYGYLMKALKFLSSFLEVKLPSSINDDFLNQIKKQFRHYESNLTSELLLGIIEAKDAGKPGYYGWRSRSGCTFCFYQQKIEWLRLQEIYPQAFENAKSYEKKAEEDRGNGTFYWLGKGTPLSSLESETRKVSIIENHELRVKRLETKLNRRTNLVRAKVKISDTDRMDEIYDEVEGGGACVTCYK
jgi:hypothetical protein